MARKNDSPQKAAMREMMRDYLKKNDISIKNGTDVNAVMRDMMSVLLEGALDEELDEELGYSKYDYRNKDTENSRNGHSQKTMRTSYGDMDIAIPREAVRRLIYTTNAIEGFNRQLRKVTKSKTVFPSDDSLLKMLYLATMDITKKWTGHRQDWGQIHSQLEIYFEERLAGRNL